jgi:hypothetical protein
MKDCGFADGRDCKGTEMSIGARYFFGNFAMFGSVINISENCICISTKMCVPLNSIIQIIISSKKEIFNIPVKVDKYFKKDNRYDIMKVNLLNVSKEYVELLKNVSPSCVV